jgi:hypothetical protein
LSEMVFLPGSDLPGGLVGRFVIVRTHTPYYFPSNS